MKLLKKYFPKSKKLTLVQSHIDDTLLNEVKALRRAQKISWKDLIESLFRAYIEEMKDASSKTSK